MKKLFSIDFILLFSAFACMVYGYFNMDTDAFAKHKFLEKDYQEVWCNANGGRVEVIMPDNSRCDCVYDQYAIEFDFATKWAEAIGQSLLYASYTEKIPGIVLILEDTEKDLKYLRRLEKAVRTFALPIRIWTMTPDQMKINYGGD